jgi:hypothetical protein
MKFLTYGRKRSQSAGSGKFEKKSSKDDIFRREDEGEGEGDGDSARKSSSGSEARLAQYEKPLTKGHKTTLREKREKDPEKIAKRKTEKRERSQVDFPVSHDFFVSRNTKPNETEIQLREIAYVSRNKKKTNFV